MEAIGAGIGFIVFLFILLLSILGFVFWIWMLIDCAKNEPSEGNDKLIWILVIVLLHLLGAIIYFFVRKLGRKT